MDIIKGKVIVLGDDVDTDQILPGYAMAEPMDQLGKFAMAGLAGLDFKSVFEPGSILVAGRNFGCGSSREHAPIAIKAAGVDVVVAKSFARIFYRNAFNMGLPLLEVGDAMNAINDGDELEIDTASGRIRDLTTGAEIVCPPLPDSMRRILASGGLVGYVKERLQHGE